MSEVSPPLRQRLDSMKETADRQGVNLWDVLNEAGLLFTEDRRRIQRAHALRQTIDHLETRSMPQLIGPAYHAARTTAKDMRVGITRLLEERFEHERKGGGM